MKENNHETINLIFRQGCLFVCLFCPFWHLSSENRKIEVSSSISGWTGKVTFANECLIRWSTTFQRSSKSFDEYTVGQSTTISFVVAVRDFHSQVIIRVVMRKKCSFLLDWKSFFNVASCSHYFPALIRFWLAGCIAFICCDWLGWLLYVVLRLVPKWSYSVITKYSIMIRSPWIIFFICAGWMQLCESQRCKTSHGGHGVVS